MADANDLQTRLQAKGTEVLNMLRAGFDKLGFTDVDSEAISLFVRRAPIDCPPGYKPFWGPVHGGDGSAFSWTCVPDDQA